MKRCIILLIVGLLLCSCSSTKKTTKRENPTTEVSPSQTETKPEVIQTKPEVKPAKPQSKPEVKPTKPFNTLSCKISGSYKGLPFSASLRMEYDSLIWVSVTELGIEAARGLLTKDSVFVMDKINKEFYAITYARAEKKFGLPLSFDFVQDMMLGDEATKTIRQGNIIGTIKKKTIMFEGVMLPIEVGVDVLVGTSQLKTTLKIKNHKLNNELEYPFEQPKNYKVKH